ncbi:hypothetical protein GON26_12315 [Flavobacterium sp. GA093]|uniref:Uncharacterized protein n=1 Tax=Flavobacterium hydrocarbonoxydans TaxID=2683249 RepID=A0A6I4NVN6_9FLAO|nr:hypothetical protein [Flavobacterium hydrocarbonoxydans]MWB95147.1 hypothetical protein [Flavobacterium hydrocarbonoxydans]
MTETIKNELQKVDFWLTIIQDSISGLTIGSTIALIGYFIWKKQNLYSKKFDVYINVISSIEEIQRVITHSIILKKIPHFNKFFELDANIFLDLKKNKILFISFFGEKHNDKIEYFININEHIKRVQFSYEEEDSTITHFFTEEEITPQILRDHKQDVIYKMHEYSKELKLVSKGLKRYALLK